MRERLVVDGLNYTRTGITPAYAGKTTLKNKTDSSSKDHPRVCGKDYEFYLVMREIGGSPPRMRERRVVIG